VLRAGRPEGWKRAGGGKVAGQRNVTRFFPGRGVGWPGGGAECERGGGAGDAGCEIGGGAGEVGGKVGGGDFGGRPRWGCCAGSIMVSAGVWHGFNRRVETLSILLPILILKKRRLRSSTT
jgi:hypothetical protein